MNKTQRRLFLIPIVIALGFIPMLVHSHTYSTGLSVFDWFPDASELQMDFFLWYKMVAIIIVSIVMVLLLLYRYANKKKEFRWDYGWYCLLGYAVLAFFSALFSQYRSFAFKGSYEVFESIWVVLGYVVMCFYSYQMIQSEDDLKFVAKYSMIGIGIITLIGCFQYFGLDIFRTTIGKKLISDRMMWDNLDALSFTFPLKTSYTTLYNTNYLAFYYGLLIPIIIILMLFTKALWQKVVYAVIAIICFITLVGSNSKSGLLALAITFVFGCVVLSKYLKKYIWIPILAAVGFAVIVVLYASRLGGFAGLKNAIFGGVQYGYEQWAIKDIDTLDDEIVIKLEEQEMHVSYTVVSDSQVTIDVFDSNGEEIPNHSEELTMVLDDASYADCRITPVYIDDYICLQISMDGKDWFFTNQIDGTYYYYNGAGKFTKVPDVKKSNLFPDSIMSGRGNLWNYIVPKLKSCIILGTGTNTFTMVYPQDNYVVKKYLGSETLFDVKAHNLYLQQFLENGLLALLAFLAFYVWYLISSFKLYRKVKSFTFSSMLGLGIMLGTFDYMIIAVANDSNVNTAPVFWVLLGLGIAINEMVKKDLQKV